MAGSLMAFAVLTCQPKTRQPESICMRLESSGFRLSSMTSLLQATVPVPKDAYKMDFVFADVPSGAGTYDNRGGFDYHLPVEGALFKERSLHVVHISVEMAPVAKVCQGTKSAACAGCGRVRFWCAAVCLSMPLAFQGVAFL